MSEQFMLNNPACRVIEMSLASLAKSAQQTDVAWSDIQMGLRDTDDDEELFSLPEEHRQSVLCKLRQMRNLAQNVIDTLEGKHA